MPVRGLEDLLLVTLDDMELSRYRSGYRPSVVMNASLHMARIPHYQDDGIEARSSVMLTDKVSFCSSLPFPNELYGTENDFFDTLKVVPRVMV